MKTASSAVDSVQVEISVVLGQATMPIHRLLRMGRGAVIELEAKANTPCQIYANKQLVARGEIVACGDQLAISVVELIGS
jgi:flagellar motor switch protein FliN/FliY